MWYQTNSVIHMVMNYLWLHVRPFIEKGARKWYAVCKEETNNLVCNIWWYKWKNIFWNTMVKCEICWTHLSLVVIFSIRVHIILIFSLNKILSNSRGMRQMLSLMNAFCSIKRVNTILSFPKRLVYVVCWIARELFGELYRDNHLGHPAISAYKVTVTKMRNSLRKQTSRRMCVCVCVCGGGGGGGGGEFQKIFFSLISSYIRHIFVCTRMVDLTIVNSVTSSNGTIICVPENGTWSTLTESTSIKT